MRRVVVARPAKQDIRQIYLWIQQSAPLAAERWLKEIRAAIKTLSRNPERCVVAPESDTFEFPIRQLLYGSGNRGTYRVLFTAQRGFVCVLHVRHGSMDVLRSEDSEE